VTLTVGSLFSGIGGMDLGLERAGHTVIWQSEIDPYCNKVLKKHWPTVPNLGDITTIDWGKIERPDIICGGYPCQPFSHAGKRNGTADPRHLWPAMHNAICELRPRYALMENVRGHLSMGFGDVLADLAKIGYDAEWQVIPAAAVGALHKRDRVFIVAYPTSECSNERKPRQREKKSATQGVSRVKVGRKCGNVANTDSKRLQRRVRQVYQTTKSTRLALCSWWETEPDVGRVADGVSNRVDRLRGLGNAVVPQVAEFVGRLIGEHAKQFK
jgi:DNA (cytosine-5)-methyltransferase 1